MTWRHCLLGEPQLLLLFLLLFKIHSHLVKVDKMATESRHPRRPTWPSVHWHISTLGIQRTR